MSESQTVITRDIRRTLDEMSVTGIDQFLGCIAGLVRTYDRGAGHWQVGMPRPALASEDPAVSCAIGRCALARVRWADAPASVARSAIARHTEPCGWCDYPLEELLTALDWAATFAGRISSERLLWQGADGTSYTREIRHDVYENHVWEAFADMKLAEQRDLVDAAVEASRS